MIKLNIGCGGQPLDGYINVDQDGLQALRIRYPDRTFSDDLQINNFDVFNLPYPDASVDEIKADAFLEHLSFQQEPLFLYEVSRVLKPRGCFDFSVPDFEAICQLWLAAKDDWQGFLVEAPEAVAQSTWFGITGYDLSQRWSYLMTSFYGTQRGEGQFHKNGYSEAKIKKMMLHLGFEDPLISRFTWKRNRDPMLRCVAHKGFCSPTIQRPSPARRPTQRSQ